MGKWLSLLIFIFSLVSATLPIKVQAAVTDAAVLINEIRLGGPAVKYGDEATVQEYVTLFNPGTSAVSLDGWLLEYAKNPKDGLSSEFCEAASWSGFANITVTTVPLAGELGSYGATSPIELRLNDSGSGVLRLVNASDPEEVVVYDVVGWGTEAPCKEGSPATVPSSGKSLTRYLACDTDFPLDTNDNLYDFVVRPTPVPGTLGDVYKDDCAEEPAEPAEAICHNVRITEILPNPAGEDAGKEFIELYNSTADEVPLKGCLLGLESNNKTYAFPDDLTVKPGEYKALYDFETGLVLPNAAGGNVLLIDSDKTEYVYSYPGNVKDNISWALIDGVWQQTDQPTPSAANLAMAVTPGKGGDEKVLAPCPEGKYRNPATNRCKTIEAVKTLTPCEEGKERNPETNRCRSIIATLASLIPCKEGQERNPATNRCRSIVTSSSSLTPCKEGQERNPATNRCRKIAAVSAELKPCAEGQERNPETNRCRKAQATLAAATGLDDKKGGQKNLINYGLLGLAGVSALGYGAYEYRHDFRYKMSALKNRFFTKNSGE